MIMAKHVSKTTYDCAPYKIVTVIASFSLEGKVQPLYVGIDGNSYKIESCWMKPSFKNSLDFNCRIIDNGTVKPLSLSYHKVEDVWVISDMYML